MRVLTVTALLARLAFSMASAQAGRDLNQESKILALERIEKVQAFAARDLKTLDTILDDAFVEVDPEGRTLTKVELLARVQTVESLQYTLDAMVVRLHGDTAIATGLYRIKGVERGKPLLQRGRFVDTWLNKNGRWVAIACLMTPTSQ